MDSGHSSAPNRGYMSPYWWQQFTL